jgi:hypothetical protein
MAGHDISWLSAAETAVAIKTKQVSPRVIQFSNLIPMRVNARSGWAAKRRHAAAMLV